MDSGWLLFACGLAFAAAATLLAIAATGTPPLLVAALAAAGVSYLCLRRSRERLTRVAYDRVGVERNPDGTVGEAGREAEPSRSADIDYEPRDDWDDPEDWPFDDAFWFDDETSDEPPGADEGPTDWWNRRTRREPSGDGGMRTLAPREQEACETLGVDIDADAEAIKRAYRKRVKETHPDHGGDRATFRRVRWAYEYLKEHRA